jgi:LCP family protein required for cell wall assembly
MPAVSRSTVRAFSGRFLIALALATSVTTAAVASVNHEIDTRVKRIRRIQLITAEAPPQGANFLIIGSDTRQFVDNPEEENAFGKNSGAGGSNSDTLMVAHVEPGAQRTLVVSFPRDLMVNVPGLNGKSRINAAYSAGGPQRVIDTLSDNFDLDIHHYVEVDFKSFQDVVDAIGKVSVYVPGPVRDLETGLDITDGPGCVALDGGKALQYVRSRSMQILDPNGSIVDPDTGQHWRLLDVRADLDRIPRQQDFIRKLAGVAIGKSLSDPFLAIQISDDVLGDIKADQTLTRDDVNALIRAFKTIDVNNQNSVQFETLPTVPDPNNPSVTLVPGPGADDVINQLRTFGENTPPPPSVVPSQVKVQVRDATGKNIGEDTLVKLVQNGFQSGGYSTSKKTTLVSEIHYAPEHVAAAKALLPFVPSAQLVKDPAIGTGVLLVLGQFFPGGLVVDPATAATTLPPAPVDTTPATTAPKATTTTVPTPSQDC